MNLSRRAPIAAAALLLALSPLRATGLDDAARAAFEREDYATALPLYRSRAERGEAEAQYRVGMMLRFGWGVERDAAGAAKMFRLAADQGHAQAQAELGTMLRLGRGVPEDPREAARLLRAAAAAGVGIAQLSIGRMYRDGVGVDKDLVEAWAWFQLAGENQVMDGFAYRNEISTSMTAEQLAAARKLAGERGSRITKESAGR